ncbi:DHHW family protein, partial [Intestinibacter sp.]
MNNTVKKYGNLKDKKTTRKPKLSDYLNIGICTLIMMFFFVSMFFTTNGGVSEQEKRNLATFPKLSEMTSEDLFSGKFFSKIDEFYKDNFVHRGQFLALSDSINGLKGVESEIKMTVVSNNATNNGATEQSDDNSDSDKDMYQNVERVGTLLSIDNIVCEAYGFNEPTVNQYAETIKKFGNTLKNSNVYNILVPTHVEFALPSKYKNLSAEQKPVIDLVNSKLGNNVTPVDAYSILKKHKTEYIYFKSDHHWTQLGAYYAYTKYCEAAGLKAFDLDDYKV